MEDLEMVCTDELPGATNFDDEGCATDFDKYADLTFDDSLHKAWYERFWSGSCDSVPVFFCISGVGYTQKSAL